jgi:hypothetical protein
MSRKAFEKIAAGLTEALAIAKGEADPATYRVHAPADKKSAPNLKSVRAGKGRQLVITWKGGAESIVDVSKHLADYVVFAPLRRDDELFRKVTVGEWGWCCHWSDDLEISSDTLWQLAREQGSYGAATGRTPRARS